MTEVVIYLCPVSRKASDIRFQNARQLPSRTAGGLFTHLSVPRLAPEQKRFKNALKMPSPNRRSLKRSPLSLDSLAGNKSGITRDAQTASLCAVPELEKRRAWAAQVTEQVAKMRGHRDAIVIDLLLFSGCRVSEVCNIQPDDILSNNQVLVRGLKGSSSRICTLGAMTDFLDFKYRFSWQWGIGLNRWYVYRICKEFGIYETILGNKKLAVTHAGRHELISGLEAAGLDSGAIAELIGHKRVSSTEHYLKHRPVSGMIGDATK